MKIASKRVLNSMKLIYLKILKIAVQRIIVVKLEVKSDKYIWFGNKSSVVYARFRMQLFNQDADGISWYRHAPSLTKSACHASAESL